MGWTCTYHNDQSSKEFLLREFQQPGWEFIDYTMLGSTFYGLCKMTRENNAPIYFGTIILTERRGGEICYKEMDESMGPNESRCPLRIINKLEELAPLSDPSSYAYKWRERCRANARLKIEKERTKQQLKPGMIVEYGDHKYRLDAQAGPRKGWYVTDTDTAARYRMRAYQLSQAIVVEQVQV